MFLGEDIFVLCPLTKRGKNANISRPYSLDDSALYYHDIIIIIIIVIGEVTSNSTLYHT